MKLKSSFKFETHIQYFRLQKKHITTPAPFEDVHIDLERDPNLPTLTYGKIAYYNTYSGLKDTTSFQTLYLHLHNILLHSFILTFNLKITNLKVSHYDCEKQHNLRQFTSLIVKQCTEAPSNVQHASVKARVYVRAQAKRIKAYKCVAYAKKERKICFQGSVKYRRVYRTV